MTGGQARARSAGPRVVAAIDPTGTAELRAAWCLP